MLGDGGGSGREWAKGGQKETWKWRLDIYMRGKIRA